MKKAIATMTLAAALSLGATAGFAQDSDLYIMNGRVMGGGNAEGAAIVDCPDGSFVQVGNRVYSCGEGGASFEASAPEAGTMMSSGEAFPEGAMRLVPSGGPGAAGDNAQSAAPAQ